MTLTAKGLQPLTRVDNEGITAAVDAAVADLSVFVTPQMFAPDGAVIGDGTARALSVYYSSLAAAQIDFPFVTSLTQTIDYACIKAMSNDALGPDKVSFTPAYIWIPTTGSTVDILLDSTQSWTVNEHVGKSLYLRYANGFEITTPIISNTATSLTLSPAIPFAYMNGASACGYLALGGGNIYDCVAYDIGPKGEHGQALAQLNKPMFIPGGKYMLGSDTWLIRDVSGAFILGAGRQATALYSSSRVFATDGLWYSRVEGIGFISTGAAAAVVDIDGNVPGQPYATRGVQANTFKDLLIDGSGLTTYGFALTRLGNPPGPGAQGSENLFLNCHFNSTVFANYFSTGFNALQNTFIGGNFQGHQKHGIYIVAGSVYLFSVGFQSTYGYTQIVNDGYDINANSGGVSDRITIIGCRTESLRFYRGGSSQPPILIGNVQSYGGDLGWTGPSAYTLNQTILKTSVTLGLKLYRVSTAGTTGSSEPIWPDSGTVADGSVVWTMTDYFSVDIQAEGVLISNGLSSSGGRVNVTSWRQVSDILVTTSSRTIRDYTTPHQVIFADTASGNQTITVVNNPLLPLSASVPDGATITIKKITTDANTVSLAYSGGNSGEAAIIPGGSTGYVTIQYSASAGVSAKWWIIDSSFGIDAAKINGVSITGTPTSGQVPKATSGTAATWQTPSSSPILSVATKTGAYPLTTADDVIIGDTTSGSFALTLPTAVGNTGKVFYLKKLVAANTLTISTTGGQTIDGAASVAITVQYTSYTVVSDGANWSVL